MEQIWGKYMDSAKAMVLLDGLPSTYKIKDIGFNYNTRTYWVKFGTYEKIYNYPTYKVEIINNYDILNLDVIKLVYIKNRQQNNIFKIFCFLSIKGIKFYRIIFENNYIQEVPEYEVKFVTKEQLNSLEYITKLAELTSVKTESGENILLKQFLKINIDNPNTALTNYLGLDKNVKFPSNQTFLIFPFGCNSSQYLAVKNAITNESSVIEGPPGTGKTQTILNIIANLLINNQNCQVVSNNNYAILNIYEKLDKYELGYLSALLGKNENITNFLNNQNELVSKKEEQNINIEIASEKLQLLKNSIYSLQANVLKVYEWQDEYAILTQKLSALTKEYNHFCNQFQGILSTSAKLIKCKDSNLQRLYLELSNTSKISFLKKLKYIYYYQIGDFTFYNRPVNEIILKIQERIYLNNIEKLKNSIIEKKLNIDFYSTEEKQYINQSLEYLKLYLRCHNNSFYHFAKEELKTSAIKFVKKYPIVLSTTYSSRNSFKSNFLFDYLIMDEASQVDIVTGTLSLSSAKNAVIIGDNKQLTNVVPKDIEISALKIFEEYNPQEYYDYTKYNFLNSFKNAISDIPVVLLKEHYRCHPLIIDFCNHEFYNNELIIMSKDNGEPSPIEIIRTPKGNHNRGLANQRQADIITELVNKYPVSERENIGIIAPYNEQVKLLQSQIDEVDISTIHKFQGREKDVIIISTVDDNLNSFITNERILNVAISRAKKKLIIVLTGNEINNRIINDLINYSKYHNLNIINSNIASVFDLLYKQNENLLLEFYKKYGKTLEYDSENIIYYLLKKILKDYNNLDFVMHYPLNNLIFNKYLLNETEKKYATNHKTHLDFLIYNTIGKKPILAIEVDGYKYHNKKTKQYERDQLKDMILKKYSFPLLRLKTTGNKEEENIRKCLNSLIH